MKDEAHHPMDLRQRTRLFALALIRFSIGCPRNEEVTVIRRQLLRSATSVGAHRARSTAEFVSKLEVALQELDETAYWLELLRDGHLVATDVLMPHMCEAEELTRILVTCVKNAKRE